MNNLSKQKWILEFSRFFVFLFAMPRLPYVPRLYGWRLDIRPPPSCLGNFRPGKKNILEVCPIWNGAMGPPLPPGRQDCIVVVPPRSSHLQQEVCTSVFKVAYFQWNAYGMLVIRWLQQNFNVNMGIVDILLIFIYNFVYNEMLHLTVQFNRNYGDHSINNIICCYLYICWKGHDIK